MSEAEIRLVHGRPSRGKFPLSVTSDDEVLFAERVNPHEPKSVEAFLKGACKAVPALKERREELKREVLSLAVPPPAKPARPPSAEDHPYVRNMGGMQMVKQVGEGEVLVPLTNFIADITADVIRDDGAEAEAAFEIHASLGNRSATLMLSASKFNAMTWPTEHLGAEAIVYPGSTTRDHARAAIQFLSTRPIPRRTTYTHSGWRKLNGGGWVYLHGGGAIGASGVVPGIQVELPPAMGGYELPEPPSGETLKAAIRASMRFLELSRPLITFPGFAAVYRSAMGSCDFNGHDSGPSGSFKSEKAALMQQHFGATMDSRHLPGSWHSTDNALEGLLFTAKDTLAVIDDFAPCGGPNEVARWHQRADRVFRAQGNQAGRARMRADGSLRTPKPPRGLAWSTGEEIPRGQSIRARTLVTEINKGDIDSHVLTLCQKDARSGLYAQAMAGFVQYLAGRYDHLQQTLRAEVEALRQEATTSGAHCRTPEIVANLAVGLRCFTQFAKHVGAIDDAEAKALWERGWAALREAGRKQLDHQNANEPTQRFIELLTSAMASGHAHLADADGESPANPAAWGWRNRSVGTGQFAQDRWEPQGDRIGWIDGDDVLLDPEAAFRIAQSMAGSGGDGLTITARTLRKRMDEKGMVIRPGDRQELLIRRTLEGRQRLVLHLVPGVLSPQPTKSTISALVEDADDGTTPEPSGNGGNGGSQQELCSQGRLVNRGQGKAAMLV